MRTFTQRTVGAPAEVLELIEVPRPVPEFGQVLIKVAAAGVNPVDVAVAQGWYPLLGEPPFTLGWDVAGTVVEVASGISQFKAGDEVFGLVNFPDAGNAFADYVLASPNEVVHRPAELDVIEAGALPLTGLTAWQALVGVADVQPGRRVLIHRAAGGVGHLAVQVAKARGAYVIATASAAKHDFLRSLGADELIDYTTTDFTKVVSDVDIVFDLVSGDNGVPSASVLKRGGVLIPGLPGNPGVTPEQADELGIRLGLVNVVPSAHDLAALASLITEGKLRVHIDTVVPLADLPKALDLVAGGHTTGKVVLVP